MNDGLSFAGDVQAANGHVAGRPKIDVDDLLVVSFQAEVHGSGVEVGQGVPGDVVHVRKGRFRPIDHDRKEIGTPLV